MKRLLITVTLCLVFGAYGFTQGTDDTPATKEDVQRYFDVMHSRDLINKMMEAMLKPMHQMMHDQYMKDKDKLPADFETRMNRIIDDMTREMPWEEIIQAEIQPSRNTSPKVILILLSRSIPRRRGKSS